MRRSFVSSLAVLIFVGFMAMPAAAAPRRDDRNPDSFIQRLVRVIKDIVGFDDARPNLPYPCAPTTT